MIRLLIVDRAKPMGDTMAKVMAFESDITVIGTATSVTGALPYLEDCDVVLVTADLPNNGALALTRAVADRHPSTRVVMMDWIESQQALRQFTAAGLAAYVLEDESVEDLLEKMRAVHLATDTLSSPDDADAPGFAGPARPGRG